MKMRMTADAQEPARCCVSGCSCTRFRPGSIQIRSCDRCGHGWVAHASEKFQTHPPSSCGPVEVALPGLVFDLSSLVLYGAQAIPVQLKILLDRLYSILTPEQVGHILHTLGWSLGDYVRGYMLQHPSGKVLDRWFMVTPKEEQFILKQFLRFGETRAIVELMTLQFLETTDHSFKAELKSVPKSCQSNVNRNGLSLLLPFDFSHSNLHCLVPPTRELVASSKLTQILQKASGKQMTESHKREGGRGGQVNDMVAQQSKFEPPLKIKNEPDKVNSSRSLWHQNPSFFNDQELYLQRGLIQQESTTSMSTSLNSSLIPSFSSSAHPSMSNSSKSPLKLSLKPQDSPSSSLHP
ncbi:zinc finger protein basonuclin-2-like, partial [Melanotaenia boesemani]|uniref:zinc finger protein basonuclin-2-like n=1 Tax=Melanotaenia boesemani TaxID=1250792 RepID=UPI001C0543FC